MLTFIMPEPDITLGGYLRVHGRPPSFEGSDGYPYTVSIETERAEGAESAHTAYLVFPRWAGNGAGIIGHVETGTLAEKSTSPDASATLEALTIHEIRDLLEDAILRANTLGTND